MIHGLPASLPALPPTDREVMRVLIACETSGRVREAFRQRGHDVASVDILPSDDNSPHHVQKDIREIHGAWDLMLAFPPCTYLSNVNAYRWRDITEQREQALEFIRFLMAMPIPRKVIENPAGAITRAIRPPDQYIHPWHFGEPYTKRTGLWLENLPPLVKDVTVKPFTTPWVNGAKRGGRVRSSHHRSKTFQGIARAMAMQWG